MEEKVACEKMLRHTYKALVIDLGKFLDRVKYKLFNQARNFK
jgi:hypothetical protein